MDLLTINPETGAMSLGHLAVTSLDISAIVVLALTVAYLAHLTYQLICLAGRLRVNLRGVRK